jgi:hypothetical protein
MNISWKQIKAEIDGLPKTEKTLALKKMADGFEKELREIRKMGAEGRHQRYKHPTKWITDQVLDELLGDSK